MLLRDLFAPLIHSLTGGRGTVQSKRVTPFGATWDDLLTELRLPTSAFADVVEKQSLHPHFHYRHFTRRKKDGGGRQIAEPDTKLKRVQQFILRRYLERHEPHRAAMAYRSGISIVNHVAVHRGAEILVTADIVDFFPNTNRSRVADWWDAQEGDPCAALLTRLTTLDGGLPQGAPTSPALSNLVNVELDARLTTRAESVGATYTRYCDDMVFSWRYASGPPSDFERGVRAVLGEFNYSLHPKKGWRVYRRLDEPEITGLVLGSNGKVRLPDAIRRKMRSLARSRDTEAGQRLAGYRAYEAMVTGKKK